LYAATNTAGGVLRFDGGSGGFIDSLGDSDVTRAAGIDFGPDGNLYVLDSDGLLDTFADRILRFDPATGELIDEFVTPGVMDDVAFFGFGSDNHVYVPEVRFQSIIRFSATTGEFLGVFAADGPLSDSPAFDVTFGPDGNAYAPAAEGIERFDGESGEFLDEFVGDLAGTLTFFPPNTPPADLDVAIDNFPSNGFVGEEFSITYTVEENSGNAAPADEWVDVIFFSEDEIFDPLDTEIGSIEHTGGLAANGSYSETLTSPALNVTPGDYHIIVFADRRGQSADTDRLNNVEISATTTEVLPRAESVDPAKTIAIGRMLSSWTTDNLAGDELTITYTAYNLTADYVTDVSLETTLQPGVNFDSASIAPTINGHTLSWEFGRLGPLGTGTVDVTVILDDPTPLQLDNGATADGIVNFADLVADAANPAVLRTDPIDQNLLAATIDANNDDVYVRAKAAELNQDSDEIFAFMTQKVGFESYAGSLRGARGTLWSSAGNALDQASLMIALLRASGIPAEYVSGQLPDALSQELILSIFPNYTRILGLVDPGILVSDPINDPELLAEVRDHFWVSFDGGGGFVPADPTFQGASIGQTFAAATRSFAEISDDARHMVNLRLDVETTSPGVGLLTRGPGQEVQTVLDESFSTADLAGKTLSVAHFISQQTLSAIITATTITYSPYIYIHDLDTTPTDGLLVRGIDYQELLTNFPFGTEIVTGLFLTISTMGPADDAGERATHVVEKTLVDRIGFAARQPGSGGVVNIEPLNQRYRYRHQRRCDTRRQWQNDAIDWLTDHGEYFRFTATAPAGYQHRDQHAGNQQPGQHR
jgi:transglutaminase-like putative cysteine protease